LADSVEKLLPVTLDYVLESASPLARDEIVDLAPIWRVHFSILVRWRAEIEFFNRIGRNRPSEEMDLVSEAHLRASRFRTAGSEV
jgi:hypothetical protein